MSRMSRHHDFQPSLDLRGAGHWDLGQHESHESFARVARTARHDTPTTSGDTAVVGPAAQGPDVYVSGNPSIPDSSEYNIQIDFQGTWTSGLRQAFVSAAAAISSFILGDVPSAGTSSAP